MTGAQPLTLQNCGEGASLWQSWGKRVVLMASVPITALALVGEGCGLTGRGPGGSRGGERPGAAPETPLPQASLAPDQAGFLVPSPISRRPRPV